MKIDILTIFPEMFRGPFEESMVKRAVENKLVDIQIHDLRNWTLDKHRSVDDRPYGGGAGMIMRVDVIDRAMHNLVTSNKKQVTKRVLMSAKGKPYSQKMAQEYAKLEHLILVAGHYEGVDERVAKHLVDEEVRVGDYVLTGGELPAMTITDSVVRLLPGVLGNQTSPQEESHSKPGYLEYPQYTRPEKYKGWTVPEVLLGGNHGEIDKWRQAQAKEK